jgi:rubrerythrin
MKKIILSVVLMLTVYGNSFAMELNDYSVFSKINNETTLRSLVRYLDADAEQHSQLKFVFRLTDEKVKSAVNNGNEVEAEKALYFNLANMKHLLSPEQYKKYLVVLNLTVAGNEEVLLAEK